MAPRIVIAATASGIARVVERAGGWGIEMVHAVDARCLAVADGAIYAGTQGSGVLRSEDGGRSWRQAGLDGMIVKSLAAAPGALFAGTKPAGVWVCRDGDWEPLARFPRLRSWFWWSPAEKPHTAYVQALAVSPVDPGILLAGIEAGALVRTADGGRTWSAHRRRASRDPHSLAFHGADGAFAYEAGGTGPAVSRDGGVSWERPREGLDRRYCWAVAADPADPERWYVSASPGARKAHGGRNAEARIFRCDRGVWRPASAPLAHMPYTLFSPAPGELYAGLANGAVLHSGDSGESWARLPFELPHRGRAFALS